jgi:predicted nucleic acid-binding protein
MSQLAFFDTNVLAYADDEDCPEKQAKAEELFYEHLRSGTAILSTQVLQEYFVVATKKLGVEPETAQRKIELFGSCTVVRPDVSDVIAAIELHRLRRISFWDALIVHAARLAGANVLFSEDMPVGTTIGGVRIVNPFA